MPIDQDAAEKLTQRIQAALLDGDEQAAQWISETQEFTRLCNALRLRPAVALQRIKESMAPQQGEDTDE